MLAVVTPETKRTQAKTLKDEGNDLVREGKKGEALKRYEKGIRLLGLLSYQLDEDGKAAMEGQTQDGRELLSVLASNAAQMYMDPSAKRLATAIERCTLAIEANPNNAKAYFRRATAAYDHADNVAKGADAILAQAQKDIRKFLQLDDESAAGKALQEKLNRKRQALLGPILRDSPKENAEVEPEWFQQVRSKAVFVCLCGASATGRDLIDLPDTLLSMATQAKDKRSISVGVAYVGYKGANELEMFSEEWQKKYYRMLRLGERAVRVPPPRQVVVYGETYNVWSLLEGRVRVMRVNETKKNGEKVGLAWMRYCSQLLWHGEPFCFQSCRSYLRFSPSWDEYMKNDLSVAMRRSPQRPVLSWMSRCHEDEAWQWVSDKIDYDDNNNVPSGTLVAQQFDKYFGWVRFRRRFFNHSFGVPAPVAFFTPHNAFSTSDLLKEVPADPFMNALQFHGQITCENVRLHSHGWDVFTPSANYTWETTHDAHQTALRLTGATSGSEARDKGNDPELFDEQKARSDALLDPWENKLTQLDEELLDMPVPTSCFWTQVRRKEPSPWDTSRLLGHRFQKGDTRTVSSFEKQVGLDVTRQVLTEKAQNGGFNSDRDFEDSKNLMQTRAPKDSPQPIDGLSQYRAGLLD